MKTAFSPFAHALAGIRSNLRGLERDAQTLASAEVEGAEPVELVDPLVDGLRHQLAIEASASVIRRVDEALGSLIDTFA